MSNNTYREIFGNNPENISAKTPAGNIVTFDPEPLGQRIPLVFIPGNQVEDFKTFPLAGYKCYGFDNYTFDPDKYKVYIFAWSGADKEKGIEDIAASLIEGIAKSPELSSADRMFMSGISFGGIVARAAVNKSEEIAQKAGKIFTIATPHHGSPLTHPAWIAHVVQGKPLLKLVAKLHRSIFANARWAYDIACDDYFSSQYEPVIPQKTIDEVEAQMGDHGIKVTYPGSERYLKTLNSEDTHKGKVVAISVRHTKVAKRCLMDIVMAMASKLSKAMIPLPNDGLVPLASARGDGLGFEQCIIEGPANHMDCVSDHRFTREISEAIDARITMERYPKRNAFVEHTPSHERTPERTPALPTTAHKREDDEKVF